jgi:phosphoglycerate dehydrogenase-like enzyme
MTTILVLADPSAPHLKHLERLPEATHVIVTSDPAEIRARAPQADVILNCIHKGDMLASALPHAAKARWLHSLFTGVEGVLIPEVTASLLPLSNGRGVFRVPLAEWTIGAMIHFAYSFRTLTRQQDAGVWKWFDTETLHGRTFGVIGYGGIGSAAAARAKALGMRIVALRRRPELFAGDTTVERFFAPGEMNALIAECDYLLLATPLTPATRHMFGAPQIAAMKPNAVLVNVGRGAVVDEAALIQALESHRIRGAALDVFEVEPLPAGHAFYKLQNVLLSPHCADHIADFLSLAYDAFFENLEHFRKGEPLEYLVDKHAGY